MKTRQPDETPIHDAAIKRALHFFMGKKGWKPSDLSRAAEVSPRMVLRAVRGDVSISIETLERLCAALQVERWEFYLTADLLSNDADPTALVELLADRLITLRDTLISAEEPAS